MPPVSIKNRIIALHEKIKGLGLAPLDFEESVSLHEQERVLTEYIEKANATPAQGTPNDIHLGEVDAKGAEVAIMQKLEAELDAARKEREELRGLLSGLKNTKGAESGGSGITADQLERILERQGQGRTNKYGILRQGYVPIEDIISPPVTFFSTQPNEYLSFLAIGGNFMSPPNEKPWIKFDSKFSWTEKMPDGSVKVRHLSFYICSSKSEVEFIKKQPKFGNSIFVDAGKAISASQQGEWAQEFGRQYQLVCNINLGDLPRIAHQLGIPVGSETATDDYRRAIAESRTKSHFETLAEAATAYQREREQDKELLRSHGIA